MLEKLDEINWAEYEHAYGSAIDVPQCIRDLASQDKNVREKALHRLYGNIYHQGSIYPATLPAIPFFFELLEEPEVKDKDNIVKYLLTLAIDSDTYYLPTGIDIEKIFSDENDLTTKIYYEISERIPIFYKLLEEKDIRLKLSVIHALAWFPKKAKTSAEHIRKILKSIFNLMPTKGHEIYIDDKKFRNLILLINSVISLALLDRYVNDKQDIEFFKDLMKSEDLYIKGSGAVAYIITDNKDVPDFVIENLILLLNLEIGLIYREMPPKGYIGVQLNFPSTINIEEISNYQKRLMMEFEEICSYKNSKFFIWHERDSIAFLFSVLIMIDPSLLIKYSKLLNNAYLILRNTNPIKLTHYLLFTFIYSTVKLNEPPEKSAKNLAAVSMVGRISWDVLEFKEVLEMYKFPSNRKSFLDMIIEKYDVKIYADLLTDFLEEFPVFWHSINNFAWEMMELKPEISEQIGQFFIEFGKKLSHDKMWAYGNDLVGAVYTKSGDKKLLKKAIKLFENAKNIDESYYSSDLYEEAKRKLKEL
ncbi:MAG: hypothetical protein ACTSQP_01375 [Promethearchaeota archaeon]